MLIVSGIIFKHVISDIKPTLKSYGNKDRDFPVDTSIQKDNEILLSSQLIKSNEDEIDKIEVNGVNEEGFGVSVLKIEDKETIQKVLDLVSGFKLIKLTGEEANKILDKGKRMLETDSYTILLLNSKKPSHKNIVGMAIVMLNDEQIIFADTDTMNSKEPTLLYISTEKDIEKIKTLRNTIDF